MRIVAASMLVLVSFGCRNTTKELHETEWDYTKGASDICERHQCKMQAEVVSVFRGIPYWDRPKLGIHATLPPAKPPMPHERREVIGCIPGDVSCARIYVCEDCVAGVR